MKSLCSFVCFFWIVYNMEMNCLSRFGLLGGWRRGRGHDWCGRGRRGRGYGGWSDMVLSLFKLHIPKGKCSNSGCIQLVNVIFNKATNYQKNNNLNCLVAIFQSFWEVAFPPKKQKFLWEKLDWPWNLLLGLSVVCINCFHALILFLRIKCPQPVWSLCFVLFLL